MSRTVRSAVLVLSLGFGCAVVGWSALFDHSNFDNILQHYIDADGFVDYSGIRDNSKSGLDSYLEQMADADLAGWPQQERLAFWINAYNARVMQLVAGKPGLKKISDAWELQNRPIQIAGKRLTLNDIEFRVLLGRTNPDNQQGPISGLSMAKPDPRVLFSLCTGAAGGPRALNRAYTAEDVDRLLRENAVSFVNDPGHVEVREGKLHLSSLFRTNKKDFSEAGGVKDFIVNLLQPELRTDSDQLEMQIPTLYPTAVYEYDWTVNDVKNKKPTDARPTPAENPDDASQGLSARHADTDDTMDLSGGTNESAAPPPSAVDPNGPSAPMHPSANDLAR